MDRKKELLELMPEEAREFTTELIDHIVNLEGRLSEVKDLPFISVNPKNKLQQKVLPAQKIYKELLQQYINSIKVLESVIYRDKKLTGDEAEESPLRRWFNEHLDS